MRDPAFSPTPRSLLFPSGGDLSPTILAEVVTTLAPPDPAIPSDPDGGWRVADAILATNLLKQVFAAPPASQARIALLQLRRGSADMQTDNDRLASFSDWLEQMGAMDFDPLPPRPWSIRLSKP